MPAAVAEQVRARRKPTALSMCAFTSCLDSRRILQREMRGIRNWETRVLKVARIPANQYCFGRKALDNVHSTPLVPSKFRIRGGGGWPHTC